MSSAGRTTTKKASKAGKTKAARPAGGGAASSRSGKLPLPDWSKLTFSFSETDTIYASSGDLSRDPVWDDGQFQPFGAISFSPAAAFMSYGLGCFEGLKAQRARDGRILLFRHQDNARRFQDSAQRLMMAPFPVPQFCAAVEGTVGRNSRFVPPYGQGSFYVRPVELAVEPKLGLGPCSRFAVLIYGCPVGGYFAKGSAGEQRRDAGEPKGVRLNVLEQGRAAPGGTGSAKVMGNYAGGITIAANWKKKGFDDVLYLDARHLRFVTETSGSNVFVKLEDGTLVTPPLDDQILPGITRDSAVRVAREVLHLDVEERPLSIEEVLDRGKEIFATGTAWTVQSIRELVYRAKAYSFPAHELRDALLEEIRGIQTGEKDDLFGWVTEVDLAAHGA
jgi:branched-chain amino acid aminotransferase